ncbi:MAG: heme ABC transporter permease [Gammaproteobacteria bacterium]|nr:heme ABC transporter permease [Gammaproteobacteria bacterium]NNF60449.1 heme ABC transporter permease [Gammaproteobacteria bacterium]
MLTPWFAGSALLLLLAGAYGGLVIAPADYQMGDGFRIIYVHVPSAWMSLFVYVVMASAAAVGLIWRIKLAHAVAASCAPIGAWFTFLALATGAIWGKPMWGTWWVWDARLTSELVLLFLYLGYIALHSAIDERGRADRAAGLLAIVGVVNVPIIHYSVEWWTTLHQPASIAKLGAPSVRDPAMLVPLLVMAIGFKLYFAAVLMVRVRGEVLEREWHKRWAAEKLGVS